MKRDGLRVVFSPVSLVTWTERSGNGPNQGMQTDPPAAQYVVFSL